MEYTKQNYELINDLTESKQFLSRKSFKKYDAKQLTDSLFLIFLTLVIFKAEDKKYSNIASNYATKTLRAGSFVRYRKSSTDLHTLLFVLYNPQKVELSSESDKKYLESIKLSQSYVREWLKNIKMEKNYPGYDRRFLLHATKKLNISSTSLRSMRQLVQNWGEQSADRKALVTTMLIRSYRGHIPRSDLFGYVKKFGKKKKYDLDLLKKQKQDKEKQKQQKSDKGMGAGTYGALGFVGGATYALYKNRKK